MLDWIAEKLGFASMLPWLRPFFGFALSVMSSLFAWLGSDMPWATIILALSLVLAIWAFAESFVSTVTGFVASFVSFYLLLALTNNLIIMRPMPHGCVAIQEKTVEECIAERIRKAGGQEPI